MVVFVVLLLISLWPVLSHFNLIAVVHYSNVGLFSLMKYLYFFFLLLLPARVNLTNAACQRNISLLLIAECE